MAARSAGGIAGLAGLSLAVTVLFAAQAFAVALILAALIRGDAEAALRGLLGVAGIAAARAAAVWWREVLAAEVGGAAKARLRDDLVARVTRLGPAWTGRARTGRVIATVVDGVEGVEAYVSRYLPQLAVAAVAPPALVAAVAAVHAPSAAVLAVAVAAALVLPRLWDARLLDSGRRRWGRFERLAADYLELTQAIPLLRITGAGGRTAAHLRERSRALTAETMAQLRFSLAESGVSTFAAHAGIAGAVLTALAAVSAGDLPAERALLVLLLARECFRPVAELSGAWHAGYQGLAAVDGLEELRTARPAVVPGTDPVPAGPGPEIEFRGVRFGYPAMSGGPRRPALDGLSFRARGGATTAIVGPSGSGKSTIAGLLERRHDPDDGDVRIGGRPLAALTPAALAASVQLVAQDPFLFSGTVRANIALARPDASDGQVRAAARAADADAFITRLPGGYDTVLDEHGANLSGGQRQRIAIARALLAEPAVLVLDEATSALDAGTERRVLRGIRAHAAGATRIVIAHRASVVDEADAVVRIDAGAAAGPLDREPVP
ncbi:ATP-binding cassette domain-containing protein [Spirillospora sp. NPDC052242]